MIANFYQQKAREAVEEWDGVDDADLVRLLHEKLGSETWRKLLHYVENQADYIYVD